MQIKMRKSGYWFLGIILLSALFINTYAGPNNDGSEALEVSVTFSDFFDFKGIVELSQEKVLIGNLRELKVDAGGDIWITDTKIMDIKIYSQSGQYLGSLGERGDGPGGFRYPMDFSIFKEKVYVLDTFALRLHVFDKRKRKFKYFTEIRDGRSIHVRAEDEIILSGQLLSPLTKRAVRKDELLCLHIVNRTGKPVKSFFPISEIAVKNHGLSDGIFFCVDGDDNIYGIQEMEYKIHKFTPGGKLIKIFSNPGQPHYTPPPKKTFNKEFLLSRVKHWMKSWTHMLGIDNYKDYLFVTLNKTDHKPYEFYLDVYTTDGKFVKGGLGTAYRLLHIDKGGIFYFLRVIDTADGDLEYSILKYALKEH